MIYFYLAKGKVAFPLPQDRKALFPHHLAGAYAWILQTYLVLRDRRVSNILLTHEIPEGGIIIFHSSHLPHDLKPNRNQLFVCVQADYRRHPFAQIHIVQNQDAVVEGPMGTGGDLFIRHWPQPNIVPRSSVRGEEFVNVGYLGVEENLTPELRSPEWKATLANMGLKWSVRRRPEEWNNYSDLDCVVAVRSFTKYETSVKPATKIFNAWHAGVPVIVDDYCANRAEWKSDLDFKIVHSTDELVNALAHLQTDRNLVAQMRERAKIRSQETSEDSLFQVWSEAIGHLESAYASWCSSSFLRAKFMVRRNQKSLIFKGRSLARILKRGLGLS